MNKKIQILQEKINEGLESGISKKSFDAIINEARLKIKEQTTKDFINKVFSCLYFVVL